MEKKYYCVVTFVYDDGRLSTYKVVYNVRMPKVSTDEDCICLRTYVSCDVFERLSLESLGVF